MKQDLERLAGDLSNEKLDDYVLPFQLDNSGARGRLVRLGAVVDQILTQHDYPEPVLLLLGEAVALTSMLGAALKFDGKFILQTQSDGPVSFMVVHYSTPGHVRGYASYNEEDLLRAANGSRRPRLLGDGHLAMTIDQGAGMDRYQGIVSLTGSALVDAAHGYFDQSEQIPTFIRIAVARHFIGGENGGAGRWAWRAGGLMVQKLASQGGNLAAFEKKEGARRAVDEDEGDGWRRARLLAETVADHELLDPTLTPDRLLYRLFHEENVRAFTPTRLDAQCTCSRERVEQMLARFDAEEVASMADDGVLSVTCEFCGTEYRFSAERWMSGQSESGAGRPNGAA